MFRLNRLILQLVLLLAGVLFLARLVGSAYPSPITSLFTNPDGSACDHLCLFGVRLRETKSTDVLTLVGSPGVLHTFALTDSSFGDISLKDTTGRRLSFYLTPDGQVVSDISLAQSVSASSMVIVLGDLITRFGPPDDGWLNASSGVRSFLYYKEAGLIAVVSMQRLGEERLSAQALVQYLILYSPENCPTHAFTAKFTPWKGFTTQRRYEHSPQLQERLQASAVEGGIAVPCRFKPLSP